ncbi:MAG: hypothetical protein IPL12_02940 [Bacteroidetes bacterium]|nr:hypothetical protein [Bacteroidota bacterium]
MIFLFTRYVKLGTGPKKADGVWAKYWYENMHASSGFQEYQEEEIHLLSNLQKYMKRQFRFTKN